MRASGQFQQVGHCGGKFSVQTWIEPDGTRSVSVGISHSSVEPAGFFLIYALPAGIPIQTLAIGGLGDPDAPAQRPEVIGYHVMIATDSHGYFGHKCPRCAGYWRSKCAPAAWPITCPYCGLRTMVHQFLTDGQRAFVKRFCDEVTAALEREEVGKFTLDIDKIADEVSKGADRPDFYYAEETQQRQFQCEACSGQNDITGHYGYCSCCGTRSELSYFRSQLDAFREALRSSKAPSAVLCDVVSAFDSTLKQYVRQLLAHVPMTAARRSRLDKLSLHNIATCARELEAIFDIKMLQGVDQQDLLTRSFLRRHVYEHNGGVVDANYFDQSGDTTVRLNEAISETMNNVFAVADMASKMIKNVHQGFHDILPPERIPVEYEQGRKKRMKG
jgi:hypothetical protein